MSSGDLYRGRTRRQRNVAEKVAREWAERRATAEARQQATDLDAASAEAEVELLDPAAPSGGDAGSSEAARVRRAQRALAAAAHPGDRPAVPAGRGGGEPGRGGRR